MRRTALFTLLIVTVSAGVVACTPTSGRFIDPVFAATSKATATYTTGPDLVSGAPAPQKLDVYQPVGDTAALRPAIVWIHGGGFRAGGRTSMGGVAQDYAKRGYVTASIDYRLDPGNRCQDVQDGTITDPAQLAAETARCTRAIEAAQTDALDAVRWLRAHAADYRLDPTRIAVGGSSAGAVTAVNVAERANPDHGPVPGDIRVGAALAMSGCQYEPAAIDAQDAPVSFLASGHDGAVPFSCVTATADAAQAAGTTVQRLFYPTERAHAIDLYRQHQVDVDKAWTAFLYEQLHLDALPSD